MTIMNSFQMLTYAYFIIKFKLNSARGQTKCHGKTCYLSYMTFMGEISRVSSSKARQNQMNNTDSRMFYLTTGIIF